MAQHTTFAHRRSAGRLVAAGLLACAAVAAPARAQDTADYPSTLLVDRPKSASNTFISHGPILGRAGATHMGVWARTSRPAEFRVFYGTRPDRLDQVSQPVATTPDRDNTGWVLLDGLDPDTQYHFAVGFEDEVFLPEHRGSFRTWPSPEQYRNARHNPRGLFNFRFSAAACQRMLPYKSSGFQPYATMLEQHGHKVHFAVHAGDWVYEEGRNQTVEEWRWRMGMKPDVATPPNVTAAPALVGAWNNYKIYLYKNNHLAAWHRHVPTFYMFDDHEILNNVYGATTPGLRSRRAVYRDIGLQAWYDYLAWSNPVADALDTRFGRAEMTAGSDVLYDPDADFTTLDLDRQNVLHIHWGLRTDGRPSGSEFRRGPGDPNSLVYGIAEVLDKHRLKLSHPAKADHISAYSIGRENYFRYDVANTAFFFVDTRGERGLPELNFGRQTDTPMLGPRQVAWLKREMAGSDADILFVVSSVPVAIPHTGSDNERGGDGEEGWAGYMNAREDMIEFWSSLGKPVIIISGDLHNAFAVKIADGVWEYTASPITSDNQHTLDREGNRPTNGAYDSGGRQVDIHWSTFSLPEFKRVNRNYPVYAVFQVNNVFNNPQSGTQDHWVAYRHPQVVVQFYDALQGDLLYAHSILADRR